MSLLSGVIVVVAEESVVEERLSSSAQPTSEASAKAARQVKIKVEGWKDVFVIVIKVSIRLESNSPMGSIPHDEAGWLRSE